MRKSSLLFLLAVLQILTAQGARAHSSFTDKPAARCEALVLVDFSRVPDVPTQLLSTKYVASGAPKGGYCEVNGYTAPTFGFILRLPSESWNGKLVEVGCGGACGTPGGYVKFCEEPLSRGYACIGSDGGHRSISHDMKWAYNNPQAPFDLWVRSPHLTALAAKAIIENYYEQPPQKSYFLGCSTGGEQGMQEAQTFPWDFDGIVANAPAVHISAVVFNSASNIRARTDGNGGPLLKEKDLKILHQAVIDSCDLNDGVKDGLIGDPRLCHFSPSALSCTKENRGSCLTPDQIHAVEKIYRGPVTVSGKQIVLPVSLRGSELDWGWTDPAVRDPTSWYNFVQDWFRYFGLEPNPGSMWNLGDLDFDRDYKRIGVAEHLTYARNPDLRRFKAAGGKLLSVMGWADPVVSPLDVVDYYETVEKVMGGQAATRDFFRMFMIPGMGHCSLGEGAYFVDYLSYLEAWVERGEAPNKLIGAHLAEYPDENHVFGTKGPLDPAKVEFTRPIYPYPTLTRYRGHGDPRNAENFAPVDPNSRNN